MKKLISLLLISIISFTSFAVEISLGATLGSKITQSYDTYTGTNDKCPYKTIVACPDFGFLADFAFEKFGIQADLDFSFSNYEYAHYDTNNDNYDYLIIDKVSTVNFYAKPYYLFEKDKLSFSLGPVIGFSFYKYNSKRKTVDSTQPELALETTDFIWGGEAAFQYELNENFIAYFSLPFLVNTGRLSSNIESQGQNINKDKSVYFGESKKLYAIPKIGIMYKF